MERELRKNQNALVIIGSGVILFGFWTVIKTIAYCILSTDQIIALAAGPDGNSLLQTETERAYFLIVFYILMAIVLLIDLSFRLYIGRSARREGLGKKRKRDGRAYLVMGILLVIACAIGTVSDVLTLLGLYDSVDSKASLFVSILVDLTSLITMLELIRAAVRSRQIRRALAEVAHE